MAEAAIIAHELTKRFGDFTAVDHVSFRVERGEVFGWLGPNGAGKTTTIRMLLGLLRPTEGYARVVGYDAAEEAHAMHFHVGYMSQRFTLYQDLTVAENIRFYGHAYGLRGAALRRRQEEILEMAGLRGREELLTANLSGGWKQRLALGCAIVHQPEVVLLDEPTAGVDPISRREFWELIYAMAKEGVTVLVTTHYMDEAELCERVGFISRGRLVAIGSPAELKRTQMRGDVLEVAMEEPERGLRYLKAAQARGELPLDEVALYGVLLHVVVPDAEAWQGKLRALLEEAGFRVHHVAWIEPTLEDVFISAVKAAK